VGDFALTALGTGFAVGVLCLFIASVLLGFVGFVKRVIG